MYVREEVNMPKATLAPRGMRILFGLFDLVKVTALMSNACITLRVLYS